MRSQKRNRGEYFRLVNKNKRIARPTVAEFKWVSGYGYFRRWRPKAAKRIRLRARNENVLGQVG
jgi:hypothetical protein